jgi:hypothetical protein
VLNLQENTMTDFALPIGPVLEVDMKAAIGELDRLAADVDREDYSSTTAYGVAYGGRSMFGLRARFLSMSE